MGVKFTPEQENAINFKGGAAIVSAAAGSGKTAVLVERIMRIICDEKSIVPANKIVVVTFTNKAASELKARLKRAVEDKISHSAENEFLKSQLMLLEEAKITTISSFCLSLIKENSEYLNQDINFNIIDESESSLIKNKALQNTIEAFYEQKSEAVTLISEWFGGVYDNGIFKILLDFYNYLLLFGNPKKVMKDILFCYSNPSALKGKLTPVFLTEIDEILGEALDAASEANALAKANLCCLTGANDNKASGYLTATSTKSDEIENLIFLLKTQKKYDEKNFKQNPKFLDVSFTMPLRKPPKLDEKLIGANLDDVKSLLETSKKTYEKAIDLIQAMWSLEENVAAAKPVIEVFLELSKDFAQEFRRLKNEVGGIDFSDMEQLALSILQDENGEKSQLAEYLSSEFEYIIVDEFQDSNDIQYEIFRLISKDEKNLFFVGDIKQSIYSFRAANPQVFSSLLNKYFVLNLNKNFRSSKTIIDSVNALFEGTMTQRTGEVDYNADAQLVCGATDYKVGKSNVTELLITEKEDEPKVVAAQIKRMLEEGFEITENETKRPCTYSDFAIILRSDSKNAKLFSDELSKLNIPSVSKSKNEFLNRTEIDILLNLLTVIDNPSDDFSLLVVLMSPLYDFDAQDLAQMRMLKGFSLFSCLVEYSKNGNKKAENFLSDLNKFFKITLTETVENLVRFIYAKDNFLRLVSSLENSEESLANMRIFLHYINVFSKKNEGSLFDFLQFMRQIRDDKNLKQAELQNDSQNAVQIMTIHGSKGLEFPICFVSDCSHRFNFSDTFPDVLFDVNLGIASRIIDRKKLMKIDTATHKLFALVKNRKVKSEEMRLLYVAATRAKEKLIFTATKTSEKNCFLNWILKSKAYELGLIKPLEIPKFESENEQENIKENQSVLTETEINLLAEKIKNNIYKKYKNDILTKIPAKLTATQIGVEHDYEDDVSEEIALFPRTPSFISDKKLTPKKRGDAYHKVMELLDFKNNDVENQLLKMRQNEKITEQEFACINQKQIENFLTSPLGKRAAKSEKVCKEFPVFTLVDFSELGVFSAEEGWQKPFVQGIVDMFFYEGENIVLVDYKTNRNSTKEQLTEEYKNQLRIYKKAIEEMTGKTVSECYLYAFELDSEIKIY